MIEGCIRMLPYVASVIDELGHSELIQALHFDNLNARARTMRILVHPLSMKALYNGDNAPTFGKGLHRSRE